MRDIVATIQPEQDTIVRTGLAQSVLVQGAPGTGKTAVGLHRAAYLLYAFRDQLARSGVLVVGPNDSFLSYIADVLPALGEIDATQATVASLVTSATKVAVRGEDPVPAALIKGDARMAEVLRRAVWSHLRPADGPLVVPRGAHQWRVGAYLADEMISELQARGVRYEAGRAMLPQRLSHQVLLRMEAYGDSPDDRVQNAVARSKPVRAYADALWPALDPAKLILRLLTDAEFLAHSAEAILSADEQRLIMNEPAGPLGGRGPLVAGRRDLDRRGCRPAAAHAQHRPRDPRRGPGPVADDAAGGRSAGQHGFGHGAGRPGPGDDAVGHPLLAGIAGSSGPSRGGDHGAGGRFPGTGFGDRVRGPAAAQHRALAGAAALGAPVPRRPGPAADAPSGGAPDAGRRARAAERGHRRGDRGRRRGAASAQAPGAVGDSVRPARRGCSDLRCPGGSGPGHAGQGTRVRPRGAAGAGRPGGRRAGRGDRTAPALRLPDPGGHLTGDHP